MTDEEQRITLAQGLGWIHVKIDHRIANKCRLNTTRSLVGIPPVNQTIDEHGKDPARDYNYHLVPDYTTSLDDAAEAEKQYMRRGMGLADHVYNHLKAVCGGDEADTAFASASQRCEALLRAMRLWENEEWDVDQEIHPFCTESSKFREAPIDPFNSPCPVCLGKGWIAKHGIDCEVNKWNSPVCPSCGGSGLRRDEKPEPKRL